MLLLALHSREVNLKALDDPDVRGFFCTHPPTETDAHLYTVRNGRVQAENLCEVYNLRKTCKAKKLCQLLCFRHPLSAPRIALITRAFLSTSLTARMFIESERT